MTGEWEKQTRQQRGRPILRNQSRNVETTALK